MNEPSKVLSPRSRRAEAVPDLLTQYGCGSIRFSDNSDALYERHLLFDDIVAPAAAGQRERFETAARSVRDVLSQRWGLTESTYDRENPKRIYYLSMEFLIGRSLSNVTNLLLDLFVKRAADQKNLDWLGLLEEEPDTGLGNGGLRRLAACFLDSMATMQLPAMGYGLRLEYDSFKQSIQGGWQHEQPDNWLRRQDQWEVPRPNETVEVKLDPGLARTITKTIGEGWMTDLDELKKLRSLADDKAFRDRFLQAKHAAKQHLVDWVKENCGETVDPDSIFDCQIKRIHEYKRQLLNALRIIVLYNRLRENPHLDMMPRTFFFAGKAAPAYRLAKLIIKFLDNRAGTIDGDPVTRGRLKVVFLFEYYVSLAERLILAADVCNQISTAGYEASGTSNMKFTMNGALTLGTRDGATIEMAEEVGEDNFFLFGLTAAQVESSRGWYNPPWHYDHEPETSAALDLIFSDHFSRHEPGIFAPLRSALFNQGDYYMHLADLQSYLAADHRRTDLYADRDAWARKAVLNVAASGKFSSARTIAQYAAEIWNAKPCPVS